MIDQQEADGQAPEITAATFKALLAAQEMAGMRRDDALDAWQKMICRLESRRDRFSTAAMMTGTRVKMLAIRYGFCWATDGALASDLCLSPRALRMGLRGLADRQAIVVLKPPKGAVPGLPDKIEGVRRWIVPCVDFRSNGEPGPLGSVVAAATSALARRDTEQLATISGFINWLDAAWAKDALNETEMAAIDAAAEKWLLQRGVLVGHNGGDAGASCSRIALAYDPAFYAASDGEQSEGHPAQNARSNDVRRHKMPGQAAQNALRTEPACIENARASSFEEVPKG